ncbi:MAG TPA: hypothetical protein VIJ33_08145 [Solirubrobacteraceae bacterium]
MIDEQHVLGDPEATDILGNVNESLAMDAHISLAETENGGKTLCVRTGYRGGILVFPEWFATWDTGGEHKGIGAVLRLLDRDELCPGEAAAVRFYFWAPDGLSGIDLSPGAGFRLWEGRFVGEGSVVRTLTERWSASLPE